MTGKTIRCAFTVFVAAAFGTVGCGLRPPQTGGPPAIGVNVAKGHATIIVAPKVVEADAYRSQAVIEKNTKGRVHHLTLSLLKREGTEYRPVPGPDGQPVAVTLQNFELDSTVELSGLNFNSDYRVVATALKNPGNSPIDKISRDDRSYADFHVGEDAAPVARALEVQLDDTSFTGEQASEIRLTPGKLSGGNQERAFVTSPTRVVEVTADQPLRPTESRPQATIAMAIDPSTQGLFPISDPGLLQALRIGGPQVVASVEALGTDSGGNVSSLRVRFDFQGQTRYLEVDLPPGLEWTDPGPDFTLSAEQWNSLLFPSRTVQSPSKIGVYVVIALIVGAIVYKFAVEVVTTMEDVQDYIYDCIQAGRDGRPFPPPPWGEQQPILNNDVPFDYEIKSYTGPGVFNVAWNDHSGFISEGNYTWTGKMIDGRLTVSGPGISNWTPDCDHLAFNMNLGSGTVQGRFNLCSYANEFEVTYRISRPH